MKIFNKLLCVIMASFLSFSVLTACDNTNNNNNNNNGENVEYLKGTEAAKLLLANTRINEGFADEEILELEAYNTALSSNVLYDDHSDDRVGINYYEKGFSLDETYAKWGDFVEVSSELQAMYATTINMSNDARLTAQLYADVKKNANITDTWLPIGGKTMLKVSDTSETLLQVGLTQEDKRIYRRYINDEGKNEYEWASANHESLKHQRYVGGSYYESFYRTNDGFLDWFVIDNSRGYWNCLRLSEFDYEGDENDCYQITNSIVGDDICLEFTIRFYKNGKYELNSIDFIEPDLSTDILEIRFADNKPKYINVYGGSVSGIKNLITSASNLKYFDYVTGSQTPLPNSIYDVKLELDDGTIIDNNQQVVPDTVKYLYSTLDFDTNATYSDLSYKYIANIEFAIDNVSDIIDVVGAYEELLTYLNLTPKFNLQQLKENASLAEGFIDNFNEYYKWNGHSLNDYSTIENIIKVIHPDIISNNVKIYDDNLNAPSLTKEELEELLKLNPNAKFGKVASYYDGNVTLNNGVITVAGATATVNDFTYFDVDSNYKIHYGIAKLSEDNNVSLTKVGSYGNIQLVSSTNNLKFDEVWLLPLSSETEEKTLCKDVNFVDGTPMNFTQNGSYELPDYLSSGNYVLVSYIAEAEEGIRVTEYTPVTFGLAEKQTVTNELGEYVAEKDDNGYLQFKATTYLDVNATIKEVKDSYAYSEVQEILYVTALTYGLPDDTAVLEVYDEVNSKYVEETNVEAVFTTQKVRLKFKRSTPLGYEDAYVYCELTINS